MVGLLLCNAKAGKLSTKRLEMSPNCLMTKLFEEASSFVSVPTDRVTLTYQGTVLKSEDSINKVGLKPGGLVMVVVLPAPPAPKEKPKPVTMKPEDIKKFGLAFGSAFKNHPAAFTKVVKRLLIAENMENLAAACPGLSEDLVGQAFLTRPELLLHLLDSNTLAKVGAEHPSVLEAAHNLAAAVHEEQAAGGRGGEKAEAAAGGGSYYLDEMDDDDDMEGEEGAGTARGPVRSRSFTAITSAQLAQALAMAAGSSGQQGGSRPANQNPFQGGVTGMGLQEDQSSDASPGARRITSDFFQAAMQQALQASLGGGAVEQERSSEPDLSEQVTQMREIMGGVMDEGLAVRALQIMGGDIQAAVDLLFSGWEGGDDSMQ